MDTRTSYMESFMMSLKRLRDTFSCDVTLKLLDQSRINCHKLVLMAASPFFETMFRSGLKESTQREVELDFPSAKITKMIVDYFYSGEIDINTDTAQELISASEFFCLADLKKHLEAFMTNQVDSTSCIEIYRFARHYSLGKLVPHCLEYILSHFNEALSSSRKFEKLSEDELIEVVSDDRLTAANEDVVFHSVVRWVNADRENREDAFSRIAPFIRFPFCTKDFLNQMLHVPLMKNPTCVQFLHEGLSLDVKSKRIDLHSMHNTRVIPRCTYDAMKPHLLRICVYQDHIGRCLIVGHTINTGNSTWCQCFQAPLNNNAEVIIFSSNKNIHWEVVNHDDHGPRKFHGPQSFPNHGFAVQHSPETHFCWNVETQRITNSRWVEPQKSDYSLMVVGEKIFSFGGTKDGQPCKIVESFDQKCNQWKPEAPMLHAVSKPYCVHFKARVYLLGGRDADAPSTVTQEFDPVQGIWKLKKEMPGVCQSGAAVSLNENIFVVGGTERACFRYTPAADAWTVLSTPAHIHSICTAATAWKGNLLLCGRDEGEEYSIDDDLWYSCDALLEMEKWLRIEMSLCAMYTDNGDTQSHIVPFGHLFGNSFG